MKYNINIDNIREWFARMRDYAGGLTGMQLASLARIVAVILLCIALYNGIKLYMYF